MLRIVPVLALVSVVVVLGAPSGISSARARANSQVRAVTQVSGEQSPRLVAQATPRSPRTYEGLRAAALHAADLPGYSLDFEAPGALAGTQLVFADYDANWVSAQAGTAGASVNLGLTSLRTVTDPSFAPNELADELAELPGVTLLGSHGVGDQDQALSYTYAENGVQVDVYRLYFRTGTVLVDLYTVDPAGTGSLDRLLALARIIDGRLAGPAADGTGS